MFVTHGVYWLRVVLLLFVNEVTDGSARRLLLLVSCVDNSEFLLASLLQRQRSMYYSVKKRFSSHPGNKSTHHESQPH
jgi:hypothetical protein